MRAVVCNNTSLQQSAGDVVRARAAMDLAGSAWQPSVTLRGGVDASRGEQAQARATLDLEWVLLDFGASSAALLESRQAFLATLDEQSSEVLTAIAQAVQLYAATQAAFWRFEAANTNVRAALSSQRMAKARLGAGAASQLERLQAETALAQTRVEFARAMNAWMLARGELALAMGWPASRPLLLAQGDGSNDAEDESPIDFEALMAEARANHPRVSASRARQAEAKARVASIESQRWGSINVAARAGRSRTVGGVGVGNAGSGSSSGTSAALEWSVPLFDRGLLRSQAQDAQGRVQVRAAELEESQRLTTLQVWQEAQTLLGERSALRSSRVLLDSAEAAFLVSSERFRLGVGSFTDLVQAQSAAAGARLQWAESRANLTRTHWRLAAAAGRFGALQMSIETGQALPR
jgi:outer membrane protein